MRLNKAEIDLSDLESSKRKSSEKLNQFNEFTIRISFLFLGAIIAAPLNLLIRPLTFQNSKLTYGPAVILNSASWWVIPLISILLLIVLILLIVIGYIRLLGLMGRENSTISYEVKDQEKFIAEFTNYLIAEGESLGMDVDYEKGNDSSSIGIFGIKIETRSRTNHVVRCIDPYRKLAHNVANVVGSTGTHSNSIVTKLYPKVVAKFEFEQQNSKIVVKFDPNNKKCRELLDDFIDQFTTE